MITDQLSKSNTDDNIKPTKRRSKSLGWLKSNSSSEKVLVGRKKTINLLDVGFLSESEEEKKQESSNEGTREAQFYEKYRKMESDTIKYFEFEIKQVKTFSGIDKVEMKDLTVLNIKDITKIVNYQQKFSDYTYQEAILNNYSHE